MSIYFSRLTVGHPETKEPPPDWDGCWKVYTICGTSDRRSCETRKDVGNLGSKKDINDARLSFGSLQTKAHTGQNFADLYDIKKCHVAHTFKVSEHEVKIFRIWGSGDIRVYFLYLPEKRIVLLKTLAKRRDKLTEGEEKALENMATLVLKRMEETTFEESEI